VEAHELVLAQAVEADAGLLAPGVVGQGTGARGLAGKIGMAAQELELALGRRRS
jgi:hypothetical protein